MTASITEIGSMSTKPVPSHRNRASLWTGWLSAVVLLGTLCQVPALARVPSLPSASAARATASDDALQATACPPLALSWWEQILNQFETALTSRQRMIQFGAVGMLLALFIIWYRKP
jgi:hypothetical protein